MENLGRRASPAVQPVKRRERVAYRLTLGVLQLLEVIVEPDDEPPTEEDRRAIAASREYFRQNPEGGVSFEQVVVDLGFTMDQICGSRAD